MWKKEGTFFKEKVAVVCSVTNGLEWAVTSRN